uniref:Ctr_118_T conopeptide n=1 Tax=Conus tribblei TaxID=101761 RepID=A0A0C9RYL5_CONTD
MKMLASVLWAMAALGVTWLGAVDSTSDQSCKRFSNGCSTPLPLPCQEYFRPACDRHDSCYQCGAHFGISRKQCDDAFSDHMSALCDELGFFGMCPARRKRQVSSGRATPIARSTLLKRALHQKSSLNRDARVFFAPTFCHEWATSYYSVVRMAGAGLFFETIFDPADCQGLEACMPDH